MKKAEWDAMETRQKETMVAEKLMCLRVSGISKSGETLVGFRIVARQSMEIDPSPPEAPELEEIPHYTTDRNACALVLDEIARVDVFISRFETELFNVSGACYGGWNDLDTLRLSPDTICYCALKAVEDASQ